MNEYIILCTLHYCYTCVVYAIRVTSGLLYSKYLFNCTCYEFA